MGNSLKNKYLGTYGEIPSQCDLTAFGTGGRGRCRGKSAAIVLRDGFVDAVCVAHYELLIAHPDTVFEELEK